MTKKKDRIPLKGGDEYDAFEMRKWYKYLNRSKVVKKIKRAYNKRFRKYGKEQTKSSGKEHE